jgi:23S rRNA (cytidine2498-2'-O)-methyltransferase
MGSWTLKDESTMLYSAKCSSLFPDGEVQFEENKTDPPSRAYLKLWETFTLEQKQPWPGEHCVDLGSSPGGWTWVLDQLGTTVTSVDKAPLSVKTSERVQYFEESAFAMEPQKVDWLFSDIICYPERLLQLVNKWLPLAKNFVCTIKFQGPTDFEIVEQFLKTPGSKVRHLSHNKHELTWILLR